MATDIAEGVSLTAGLGVVSSISAGVCAVAKEVGGMRSEGARVDGSVAPGMLGSIEGMGRGEMPGRFRGGKGGKPTEKEKLYYYYILSGRYFIKICLKVELILVVKRIAVRDSWSCDHISVCVYLL